MNIPVELAAALPGYWFAAIRLGESGAGVWRCTNEHAPTMFLKTAPIAVGLQLESEVERMQWMKVRALPVPEVRDHGRIGDIEYMLVDEVPGFPASAPQWSRSTLQVVRALGEGLAFLHQTSITGCPFDRRIARQVSHAKRRLDAGQVREDDFDDERMGRSAADLFAELLSCVPADEDLVFAHGDFCLPNLILQSTRDEDVRLAGLIDCGRAGVADRHQDLTLATRSITYNVGREWVKPFLDAYGSVQLDPVKTRFFALLDEFF